MAEELKTEEAIWIKFLRRHWKIVVIIGAGLITAGIGALLIFLAFKDWAIFNSIVPADLGQWTLGYTFTFILNLILWEFLSIGLPVIAAAAVIFLQWWNKLPDDEKEEYTKERKKTTPRSGITAGTGGSIVWGLTLIVWLIMVYADGKWDLPFQSWQTDYLIMSSLTAFLWVLLIAGIPVAIFVIWWIRRELKTA